MEQQKPAASKGRETLLTFSLVAILGGAFIFFLNLVSLGIFIYVIAAIVGIAAVGFLHYAVWGYALSRQVAGEREEQRIKELLDADQDGDETMPWKSK
jgi:Flp pilus assembly protein TadB